VKDSKTKQEKATHPLHMDCGRWGKSKREQICQEYKPRESEAGEAPTNGVNYRATESNGPDEEICNQQIKAEHKADYC
jgi:hypothetical protein